MDKGGKRFQNDNKKIKELQKSLEKLENQVVELQDQLEMKEQVIKFLQLQILEKKMNDTTCDTDNLIQVCETKTVTDDSLSSDEKESLINSFEDDVFNHLQHWQHSELVFVKNNPFYDDNDNDDVSYQQRVQQKLSGSNPKVVSNEDESIYEPIIQAFSFESNEENLSMMH